MSHVLKPNFVTKRRAFRISGYNLLTFNDVLLLLTLLLGGRNGTWSVNNVALGEKDVELDAHLLSLS